MSLFWFCSFLVLLVLEIVTINLVSVWFAIGAMFTFFVSLLVDNLLVQLLIFILVSVVALLITKPVVKKLKTKSGESTNVDRIIGKNALVLKDICKYHPGEVKVLGNIWTAVSDEEIKSGEEVIIERIEGVKVRVKRINN